MAQFFVQFFSSKIIRHIVFHKNQHFSVLNLPLCVSNDPSADLAFFCGKLSNSIPISFRKKFRGIFRQIIHCCYFYTMNARQIPQQFLPQSVPFIQRNQARRGNFHTDHVFFFMYRQFLDNALPKGLLHTGRKGNFPKNALKCLRRHFLPPSFCSKSADFLHQRIHQLRLRHFPDDFAFLK